MRWVSLSKSAWLAILLGFFAGLLGLSYAHGRKDQKGDSHAEDLERANHVRRRARAARERDSGRDAAERLRSHGRLRD